jgi:hypothetical protein
MNEQEVCVYIYIYVIDSNLRGPSFAVVHMGPGQSPTFGT